MVNLAIAPPLGPGCHLPEHPRLSTRRSPNGIDRSGLVRQRNGNRDVADPPDRKFGFVSYAHDDAKMFRTFRKHLAALESWYPIGFWTDQEILAGENSEAKIEQAIANAAFYLLILSPYFVASEFIRDRELPAIRTRHAAGVPVVPVKLRACISDHVWPGLETVPTSPAKRVVAIDKWRPINDGYHTANTQIARALEGLLKLRPVASGKSP